MRKKINREKAPEPIDISKIREVTTVLGPGTDFTGSLSAEAAIRIDGCFNGDIKSTDTVIVGEKGRIVGTVTCSYLFVGGVVEGTVDTKEKLEIAAGGYVNGDITTPSLVISQGATFDGSSRMKTPVVAVKAEA